MYIYAKDTLRRTVQNWWSQFQQNAHVPNNMLTVSGGREKTNA